MRSVRLHQPSQIVMFNTTGDGYEQDSASCTSSGSYEISEEFSDDPLFLLVCPVHSTMVESQLKILQVENTIFAINQQTLVGDSGFFKELFCVPPEDGESVAGLSVENPLRIEGVKKDDMVLFLKTLYPR